MLCLTWCGSVGAPACGVGVGQRGNAGVSEWAWDYIVLWEGCLYRMGNTL